MSSLVKSSARAMEVKPSAVICAGDSTCVIASIDVSVTRMKPFFHNRISEIKENMGEVKKICPVEDFHFIPGVLNPADIATRDTGKLEDIRMGSEWQSPSFLRKARESWPLTRDFVKDGPPAEESRTKTFGVFSTIQTCTPKLWERVSRLCNYSNDWSKVVRLVALVARGPELDISDFRNDEMIAHVRKILVSETGGKSFSKSSRTGIFETRQN